MCGKARCKRLNRVQGLAAGQSTADITTKNAPTPKGIRTPPSPYYCEVVRITQTCNLKRVRLAQNRQAITHISKSTIDTPIHSTYANHTPTHPPGKSQLWPPARSCCPWQAHAAASWCPSFCLGGVLPNALPQLLCRPSVHLLHLHHRLRLPASGQQPSPDPFECSPPACVCACSSMRSEPLY